MKKFSFSKPAEPLDIDAPVPDDSGFKATLSINKRLIIGITAAVLVLALGLFLPAFLEAVVPPDANHPAVSLPPQASAVPAGNSELAITAYAEEWKETPLQPGVTIKLAVYSPTQSSVPGLPFIITAGEGLGKDSIRIDVDAGGLITWNPPDYTAKQRGRTYVLSSGDTLYWSPLDNLGGPIDQCSMTVTAYDSANEAHAVSIAITQNSEFNYTAEIKK